MSRIKKFEDVVFTIIETVDHIQCSAELHLESAELEKCPCEKATLMIATSSPPLFGPAVPVAGPVTLQRVSVAVPGAFLRAEYVQQVQEHSLGTPLGLVFALCVSDFMRIRARYEAVCHS